MKNTSKDDLTLKITGSGFAKLFNPKLDLTEAHGASIYLAPELITRKEFGTKFDIWSAGVLFHLFLVGYPPFVGANKNELFQQITTKDVKLTGTVWDAISQDCKNLIQSMLTKDDQLRPSAETLLKHKWFDIV